MGSFNDFPTNKQYLCQRIGRNPIAYINSVYLAINNNIILISFGTVKGII